MSLLPLLLLASPASAATNEQKMETCKFGADDQKLAGAKRKAFMAKCMANRNDKRGPGQGGQETLGQEASQQKARWAGADGATARGYGSAQAVARPSSRWAAPTA